MFQEPAQDEPFAGPAELALLLACARWPQRSGDRELIRARAAAVGDWPLFLRLVQHHRIVPLVAHSLQASMVHRDFVEASPGLQDVLEQLRSLATASARESMRCLSELRRIVQKLASEDIAVRVLKGLPLAQAVFGDLSLRSPGDIDLAIEQSAILPADRVLRSFGYSANFPLERFSAKRLAFYSTHWKDLVYTNPATGIEIDLHWRCFRNSAMPGAELCAGAEPETLAFGSLRVETMPRLEGLLYLCVHGTLDGWLYLKSLVDVAAQVRAMTEAELDGLASLASVCGTLPELTAALILVRRYFAIDCWSARLLAEDHATVRHILRYADAVLVEGGFLASRESIPIGKTLAFELGLRQSWGYRSELLLRVLFRARMWETIPLPDSLFGIYPLLSPLEWGIYRLRQWWSKPASGRTLAI